MITVLLMELGIEFVSDYLDWGRGPNEVSDNGNKIALEIKCRQEFFIKDITFVLGRLHESLKEFRIKRDANIKSKRTSISDKNRKRLRMEAEVRDKGSTTTSFKHSETLNDFIQ